MPEGVKAGTDRAPWPLLKQSNAILPGAIGFPCDDTESGGSALSCSPDFQPLGLRLSNIPEELELSSESFPIPAGLQGIPPQELPGFDGKQEERVENSPLRPGRGENNN